MSAVVSAVSVTQMVRAGLETGAPVFGSLAAAALSAVPLPSAVEVLRHLGVGLAARGLEGVLAHDLGERLCLGAGVDLLAGDGGVGRADDLLASKLGADPVVAVGADGDGADAEGDERDAGGDARVSEELGHGVLCSSAEGSIAILSAQRSRSIRARPQRDCGKPATCARLTACSPRLLKRSSTTSRARRTSSCRWRTASRWGCSTCSRPSTVGSTACASTRCTRCRSARTCAASAATTCATSATSSPPRRGRPTGRGTSTSCRTTSPRCRNCCGRARAARS